MRELRYISSLLLAVTTLSLGPAPVVSARSVSASGNEITITAIVAEHRGIVVDASRNIVLFYSNTPKAVTPEVRLGSESGPIIPLTPVIAQAYDQLLGQIGSNKVYEARLQQKDPLATAFPRFVALPYPVRYYEVKASASNGSQADLPYLIHSP